MVDFVPVENGVEMEAPVHDVDLSISQA